MQRPTEPLKPYFTRFKATTDKGDIYVAECERTESGVDSIKIMRGSSGIYLQNADRSVIIQLLDASGEFFDSLDPTTEGGQTAGGS